MRRAPCRVLVLGSGEGTNFEALAAAADGLWEIIAVGSDRPRARLLERARRHGIATFVLASDEFPGRAAYDAALANMIASHRPDLVVLAGYMRILGPDALVGWQGKMLNIHPSLLPDFPGLDTHVRALAAGVPMHGATVHFVTATLDAGPRIVQGRLKVHASDTPKSLRRRVQNLEHRIYPLAVSWFATGRLRMEDNEARLDGKALVRPIMIEEQTA